MSEFARTPRTTITRLPARGVYDRAAVYAILDEALFCTLAFVVDGKACQIPTGHVRVGNAIYVHGSVGSHYMRLLAGGHGEVCVSVTLLDALVLARSAFHHSVNYRSVVFFSTPHAVTEKDEVRTALGAFTNKMVPGRWEDVRQPTDSELKKTLMLAFPIEEASAKVRTGPPKDDEEDLASPYWAGLVPIETVRRPAVTDPSVAHGIGIPAYLNQ